MTPNERAGATMTATQATAIASEIVKVDHAAKTLCRALWRYGHAVDSHAANIGQLRVMMENIVREDICGVFERHGVRITEKGGSKAI